MRTNVLEKKIPTALGLIVLLLGLGAGVFLVSRGGNQDISSKAGPTATPKNVKISNLGSNGLTVSWTTDTPVVGYLKYSADAGKITTPAGDVRDQVSGTANPYINHYVNLTNLNPDQIYYFVIGSGPTTYKDQDKPFQTKTYPQTAPVGENVISGRIVNGQGVGVQNAIVFVDISGSGSLSTVTKTGGAWRLNLTQTRNSEGKPIEINDETNLSIFAQSETAGNANAQVQVAKAKPTEDVILGKTQNFMSETTTVATKSTTASEEAKINTQGFTSLAATNTIATESEFLTLVYPALNGEMISTSSPEFRGQTSPGTTISISLVPTTQTTNVVADGSGVFRWTPQTLQSGVYTINLKFKNATNTEETLGRTFSILAGDNTVDLPAFSATPSAIPTTTPTATPTATIMPATNSGQLTDAGISDNLQLMSLAGIGLITLAWILRRNGVR